MAGTLIDPAAEAYEAADAFARQSLSKATLRAYRADWQHFLAWCRSKRLASLPAEPQTLAAYLASQVTTHSRSTIERRIVAIGQAHKIAGHDWRPSHPIIRATLKGMFRTHGRPQVKAAALGREEVVALLSACTGSFAARRDRTMFLLAFAGALRRSELAAIRVEDLRFTRENLRLFLPRSKTDGENRGAEIGIAPGRNPQTCPVAALNAWLNAAAIDAGPVFRAIRADGALSDTAITPDSIGRILRRRAAAAGLDADAYERITPHGFRAGFITDAYRAGARDEHIMGHSRHKSLKTMHGYIRRAKLMSDSPSKLLGL